MKSPRFQGRLVLRILSLGLLLAVMLIIVSNFISRSRRQLRIPEVSSPLEGQKIDKKEEVEFREIRRNEEYTRMTADQHYIGEDNLYHLEGNVELSFYKRSEGDIVLKGNEIIHNRERTYFWLKGGAIVEFKDLVIKSPAMEFDVRENMFSGDQGIQFFSGSISGAARKFFYDLNKKKAQLIGKVHLEIQPSLEDSLPVKVDTEFLEYFVKRGKGSAEKTVELVHGKSHVSAGLMRFELAANRDQIKSLFLKERVKITLIEELEEDETLSNQTTFSLYGDRCEIEADEISLKGFVGMPQIDNMEARGNSTFRFFSENGNSTQIEGKKIFFNLSHNGRLKKLSVLEDARITEKDKKKGSVRYIEGQTLLIDEGKNILKVDGTETTKARIRSPSSEISSRQINIFLKNDDIETEMETEVIIYPEEDSPTGLGFFSGESPVFITADNLRYFDDRQRFIFSGGVKLWQLKEMFLAQNLSMDIETGAVQAKGSIRSSLPYKPKNEDEEERIRIESTRMAFDPEKKIITYTGGVILKVKDISLKSRFLTITLEKESGEILDMTAKQQVVVLQNIYEGRGEEARFDVKEEVITMVGNPVLIDKERGKTEGGKLTFSIADDRIVIENKDRERSITVIK